MNSPEFYVETETCSTCGNCVEVCPARVIDKNEDGKPFFKSDYTSLCIACGQCMAICRTKSIHAKGLDYEKNFFELTDEDDFFTLLEHRRSVRRFKPKPVEIEKLEKILQAVSHAPHGVEHHNVEVTVINSRDIIMEALPLFSGFYDKLGKWLHNPFITYMIRRSKGKATIKTLKNHLLPRIEKGIYREISYEYDTITRGAHTLLLFHAQKDSEEHVEDAHIMVSYATLAAQAIGLGSTIIGLVPAALNKSSELRKLFQIPDDHDTVISLILGYPKYKYRRGIKRELKNVNWLN